ncbi:MAG: hypothetical protein RR855_14405 [Comamonas sp.]
MAPEHHGGVDPDPAHLPPTPLLAWEQRMQRAQALWHHGEQEFALAQLVQAIPLAHQLLRSPYLSVQPDDYLAAWVVTHLWIAELLAERQQLPAALDYLCDAHTALLGLGHSTESPPLQQAAWRHQRETLQALLQWQRQHGPSSRVSALLDATRCAPPAPPCAPSSAPTLQREPLEPPPGPAARLH